LKEIIEKEVVPRFVLILPKPTASEKKWWTLATRWSKPGNWINKKVLIYFVCPITLRVPADAEGYETKLRQDWVIKYGPALLMGLRVLKIACALGRLAGLPLPVLSAVPSEVQNFISDHTGALSTMYSMLRQDKDLETIGTALDERVEEFTNGSLAQEIKTLPTEHGEAVRTSYEDMREIAKGVDGSNDLNFDTIVEKCGLVREYHQGRSAFVGKDVKHLYVRMGEDAFGLSEERLRKELNRIII
jgi:hypothetical protein